MAVPRRPAADRHETLRPLQPAGPRRHRRPSPQRTGEADADRLRMGALARRRPLPLRLQRASLRREGRDRHRLRRTRRRALRGARDRGEQIALRQRLRLSAQPLAARAARPPRDPASLYQAAPAADQRQGRTIPTNPQTRVGTRSDLPLLRPPRPGTVTLAQLLQRAQTAQLTRRTPTPPIT